MQLCHTVDRAGSDDRQMRHADVFLPVLVDDAHPAHALPVQQITGRHIPHEPGVDLVDDLERARQQLLQHADRPLLERLGQDRVVGIAGRLRGDLPGLVPTDALAIDEQAHEFGDHQRGMGVIQLQEHLVGELLPAIAVGLEPPQDILQGARHEEVLLPETEFPAFEHVVVRIKHFGQVFGQNLVGHRVHILAAVEVVQVELLGRLRGPEPQRIHRASAIAHDRQVVRHAHHGFGIHPSPFPAFGPGR